MGNDTKASGKMGSVVETADVSLPMAPFMKVVGKMIKIMDKELIIIKVVKCTKAIGSNRKCTAKVFTTSKMEKSMMANGVTTSSMEKAS